MTLASDIVGHFITAFTTSADDTDHADIDYFRRRGRDFLRFHFQMPMLAFRRRHERRRRITLCCRCIVFAFRHGRQRRRHIAASYSFHDIFAFR